MKRSTAAGKTAVKKEKMLMDLKKREKDFQKCEGCIV
jgi:hypothetical protein